MKRCTIGFGWLAVGLSLPLGWAWSQGTVTMPLAAASPGAVPPTSGAFPTVDPDTLPIKPVPGVVKLPPRPFVWKQMSFDLPASIKVYEGDSVNQAGQPVKAWYADVDYGDRSLVAKSLLTDTKIGREATTSMAKKTNAYIAVNGGYFDINHTPSTSSSLVISGGQVQAKALNGVVRGKDFSYMTRGVFGVRDDRSMEAAWIAHVGPDIYSYPAPLSVSDGKISAPTKDWPAGGRQWKNITEAIGGGPMLVRAGEIRMTGPEERWGDGHSLARHPRTAIGSTPKGHMILFVGDGRKPDYSMGFTLPELAQTMKDLGCTEALNLDGGGSSTFVVLGKALNRMTDGRERNVTTAFAIVPATK